MTLKHILNDKTGWRVGSVGGALHWRSKGRGFEPVRSTRQTWSFSELKRLCWLAVGVLNTLCVYARVRKTMYARSAVFHVRVRWIMETRKYSALIKRKWSKFDAKANRTFKNILLDLQYLEKKPLYSLDEIRVEKASMYTFTSRRLEQLNNYPAHVFLLLINEVDLLF